MIRFVSVILIAACLLTLSACRQAALTPMIEIQDQDDEEGTITFSFTIDEAGWLVLHPATSEGEPDTSTELRKTQVISGGEYTDIEVTMPAALSEDRTVFAMLHYDDPADGKLTFATGDDPPVEVEGEVVQVSLTIPGVPPYVDMQQNVSDNTITIKALIYQPSWLVLRPATSEGEPDTSITLIVFGFEEVGNYDFTITMTGALAGLTEGDTLFAILHNDDPLDEEFTFVPDGDEDLPVEADGSMVVYSFEVSD